MDTVNRFDNRVGDYVGYRPGYPLRAVRAILDGLGPPERLLAADVGAGTGISARLIGNRGVRVVAVEPGERMRGAAAAHPNIAWVSARAEALGLQSGAFDLVLCAQSFHWFKSAEALSEFARILKGGGRLTIMWNGRNNEDRPTAAYREAIVDVGGDITAERLPFDPEIVDRSTLFSPPHRTRVPNFQRLDLEGLVGRARSASYVPKSGAAGERLISLLRVLHTEHADAAGLVTLVYETEIFCWHKL
ncbi:MAG TPA: class I SAM-dependent methyltransferase [Gemmatimonadaceae bacterium]|nr:class I SAM-dependent methyltransferase [Gemmatimonadaceae bacterium]